MAGAIFCVSYTGIILSHSLRIGPMNIFYLIEYHVDPKDNLIGIGTRISDIC